MLFYLSLYKALEQTLNGIRLNLAEIYKQFQTEASVNLLPVLKKACS